MSLKDYKPTVCVWLAHCGDLFFQAEDGIRYLVRSRGLGDVYKRQPLTSHADWDMAAMTCEEESEGLSSIASAATAAASVSYTHLTLPTSDLV